MDAQGRFTRKGFAVRSTLIGMVALVGALAGGLEPLEAQSSPFIRGDVNQDGRVDVSDPVSVLLYLFLAGHDVACVAAADFDDNGAVNVTDAIFGLRFLFSQGDLPPAPYPRCGMDPTPDGLGCEVHPCAATTARVEVAADCTASDPSILGWTITNLDSGPITLDWTIEGSDQGDIVTLAAAGTVGLLTAREPGLNVLALSLRGEEIARLGQGSFIFSEIMASNAETVADEDGDSSDWIEIHMLEGACADAMDLEGYFLSGDPTHVSRWEFPSVDLEKGDYLLVFASGKDRASEGAELHTSFKLDAAGEYLALLAPDGVTVIDAFAPAYPEQLTDVSYGVAQSTTPLVRTGHPALYRVPAAADAGLGEAWADPLYVPTGWKAGTTGLGFSGIATEGFEVTTIKATGAVDHLTQAQAVLADPGRQAWAVTETAAFIDYFNTGGRGNYTNDNAFPGLGFADVEDFIVLVTGTVLIPEAGAWSFGVNSDDGFSLDLSNGTQSFHMEFASPRGPADTIQIFNVTQPGPYELSLLYYERGGGAELELFAAQGNHPSFSYDHFRLVGDTASGGLGLLGFAANIATDVGGEMRGVNASLWARLDFDVEDPLDFGSLWLRMRYEDGFVAYLNGLEVARRNAPASVRWSSSSASDRPIEAVTVPEEINLTSRLGLLAPGTNVLAIHGLNNSVSDADFLVLPELVAASKASRIQYMATPTPGAFNVAGAVDFARRVEFSVERGFYEGSFPLVLSTSTEGAQIRYTLDGSTPTSSRGSVYSGPIAINRTSVVRAAAFKPDYLDSAVTTSTYIFVSDVIRQSPTGGAPGAGWPTGTVNGQVIDYGMDPDVVNNALWSGQIEDALLDIPSLSLVTDLENLFSPSTGIYVNAGNDGRAWERRTSMELLNPDGTPGFGLDAGLRIRGAFSRSGSNPKHSFRVIFRNEYGAGKLEYPLFGGEGVDRFDRIDLRTSQNYSWAFEGSTQNTFLRDVFSRDAQKDMGKPYTRSRYYNLYINGQYWGLYQTQERADADFAASYLGGRAEEYDVIKNDSSGSRALHATDGTMDSYRRLYDAAVAGFSTNQAYLRALGLRSDGSFDPAGERLLDPENLMDYMVCTYYTGDPDAPVSCWAHFSNNVFAIYNRVRKGGFTWYRHDAEHSLGSSGGLNEARLLTDSYDRSIGQEWRHFNPAWLHLRLTANQEYLMAFSDRVSKFLWNGGLFTSDPNIRRWLERAGQIDLAIIAESARWGDAKTHPPRTKVHWQDQVNSMVNTYFPQRTQLVINQMRSVSMFPSQALIAFNRMGGEVEPGFRLTMTQTNGTAGTIYYTLDGTDPRLWGGAISPLARIYADDTSTEALIPRGSTWRYLDDGSDQGTAWREPGFADGSWKQGPAELGYGDGGEATVIGFGPNDNAKYATTYFRRTFTVADASAVTQLTLGIVRDDGAAVYVNGLEAIPRINLPSGPIGYQTWATATVGGAEESTFFTFDVDPSLLVDGTNVIAVEVHQASGTSGDLSFDLELDALVAGPASPPLLLSETTTVRARVRTGSGWGAMTEARFTVGLRGLVINEFMASNRSTLEDLDEPGEYPDWIELYNGTSSAIDLGGLYLTDDVLRLAKWRIAPGVVIGSGQWLVFLADDDGTQGPLHTNFNLSASGEAIALVDADGQTILDAIVFDAQEEDVSFGRFPDGADDWGFHLMPTPGTENLGHRP